MSDDEPGTGPRASHLTLLPPPGPREPELEVRLDGYRSLVAGTLMTADSPPAAIFALGMRGVALRGELDDRIDEAEARASDAVLSMVEADSVLAERARFERHWQAVTLLLATIKAAHIEALARAEQERRRALLERARQVVADGVKAVPVAEAMLRSAVTLAAAGRKAIAEANAALPDGELPLAIPREIAAEEIFAEDEVEGWVDANGSGVYYATAARINGTGLTGQAVDGHGLRKAKFRRVEYRVRGEVEPRIRFEFDALVAPADLAPDRFADERRFGRIITGSRRS